MPINLQGSGPIVEGWGPPPQLHAPEIGSLVGAILRNRLGQQELTQKSIADAVKEMQQQRESSAYIEAAQKAGLLPEGDYGGLGLKGGSDIARLIAHQNEQAAREAYMKPYYQALTERAGRPSEGRGSGTPRYDYHGVLLTGSEYQKRLDQDKRTEEYGRLTNAEAKLNGAAERIAKEWGGVNPDTLEFNNKPTMFRPGNQVKYQQDYAKYLKHIQDATEMKTKRQNYEKWYKGTLQPGATEPGGYPDEEDDTSLPQGSAAPVPPPAQASPSPAATPRPGAPPPADTAAGHAPTYGTPAPGVTPASPGSGQVGDLVVGQSKRPINGKMHTWWGDKGWLPD